MVSTTETDMKNYYVVVYRTGGTVNFKWHHTIAYASLREAKATRDTNLTMGYPSYVVALDKVKEYGLPNTFEFTYTFYTKEI